MGKVSMRQTPRAHMGHAQLNHSFYTSGALRPRSGFWRKELWKGEWDAKGRQSGLGKLFQGSQTVHDRPRSVTPLSHTCACPQQLQTSGYFTTLTFSSNFQCYLQVFNPFLMSPLKYFSSIRPRLDFSSAFFFFQVHASQLKSDTKNLSFHNIQNISKQLGKV